MEKIRVRDPGLKKVGSRIWDKNLGSATLVVIGIPSGEILTLFLSFLEIPVCIVMFSIASVGPHHFAGFASASRPTDPDPRPRSNHSDKIIYVNFSNL
jgi:hypothetical protein